MNPLNSILALTAVLLMPHMLMGAGSDKSTSDKKNKVVFKVTSSGAEEWMGALRNVENAKKSLGGTVGRFEVVLHGKGLGLLLAKNISGNPELKEKLEKLHAEGVVFAACENTMKREKVEKEDLVELATTVDSGIGEVIRKQGERYLYVKIGA